MSIKHKLLLSFLVVALLIGLLGGLAFYHDIEEAETVSTQEAINIAKSFSLFAVRERKEPGSLDSPASRRELQQYVEQIKRIQNRGVVVVDTSKRIIAGVVPAEVGMVFSHDQNDEVGMTMKDGRIRLLTEKSEAYSKGIKELVMPLEPLPGARIGAVILEYTSLYDERMRDTRTAAMKSLVFYLAALVLSLALGYFISRHISSPLCAMKQAALKVAQGDLEAAVDHRSSDELGLLADGLNKMTAALKQARDRLLLANRELEHETALRRTSEEAQRESGQKLRILFESATDALFILDLEGNFIDVNRTAYERLGYTKEEMLSMHVSQLDPPEFAAQVPERIELLKKQGWAIFESAHLRKDGSAMPVEINARILDLGGREVLYSIVRDITERKQAEDALKKTNARLNTLVQAIPDMVFFKDAHGRHVLVNRAVEQITGLSRDEMLGKTAADLLPPGPAEACRKSDEEAMQRRTPMHVEERVVTNDGKVMYIDIIKAAMVDGRNNVVGLVMIGRDITDRKRVEEELRKHREQLMSLVEERTGELQTANEKLLKEIAERERMEAELLRAQKLESLGILAGGIAHDFNNLLTTVLGNISMALLHLDHEHPAHKQLAGAQWAAVRAQDLTLQLLTFSKGGAPIKRTASIGDLIRESAGFALRGSRVRCDVAVPDDLWLVDVDEGQMSQVIHNLVINADQAMPEGGTIAVRCENMILSGGAASLLSPGKYVKVMVRDSGVGISKDHLPKIFDPYYTTKQGGSGLGLATAYSIIQKHGGRIFVESEAGAGATFTILLPVSSAPHAAKQVEDAGLITASGKILLMDDDEGIRQTTGDALGMLGYSVVCAEDGARAIDLYQEAMRSGAPFDAVIMDLTVPGGMGGEETIKRLFKIDPGLKAIVSSGYSNDPVMADFQSYGFAAVVTKPYRLEQLGETVYRVVTKSVPRPDVHPHGSNPRTPGAPEGATFE